MQVSTETTASQDSTKTKIFVSYSRRNLAFAEKLHLALEEQGYDVLLDRKDIAAGEDWKARLNALIIAADTVVFVVSPASVESKICGWEVEEAYLLGKRILPVIAQKTEDKIMPPELSRLNFIFFDGKTFDIGLTELLVALKQDNPWLREHTRLGDLALQWSDQKSGVLRGPALEQAERWISSPPREAGVATDLHRQFIAASRKAATNRQRYWVSGILVVAIVSVGLTIWSEINRRWAVEQQKIAEKQTKRAEAAVDAAVGTANDMVFELAQRFQYSSGVPIALVKDVLERARGLQKKLLDSGEASVKVKQGSADALSALVETYQNAGELEAASSAARDSFEIRQALVNAEPNDAGWKRDLSISYEGIGNILSSQGNLTGALDNYRKSLVISETLAQQDKGNAQAQRNLSVIYSNIGDVLTLQGDFTGSLESYRKGLGIAESLALQDKGNAQVQRDLSVSYERIGDVLTSQGDLSDALENYRKVLSIAESLAQQDKGNAQAQSDLSASYNRIGNVLTSQGNLSGALENYRKDLSIAETLAQQDKGNAQAQSDLSISYEKIGNVLTLQGNLAGASENFRKGLVISETLAQQDKGNAQAQRNLSLSYSNIGDVLTSQGDLSGALENYRKDLSIAETLAQQDKGNAQAQSDLSISYEKIGNVLTSQGDMTGALENYRQGLNIRETLAQQGKSNARAQRDLSISYEKIGNVLTSQGDMTGALENYRQGLNIRESLAKQDKGNAEAQRDLAVNHWKLASARDAPREHYGKALRIFIDLKTQGKLAPSDEPYIAQLEKLIAALPK